MKLFCSKWIALKKIIDFPKKKKEKLNKRPEQRQRGRGGKFQRSRGRSCVEGGRASHSIKTKKRQNGKNKVHTKAKEEVILEVKIIKEKIGLGLKTLVLSVERKIIERFNVPIERISLVIV